MFRNDLNRGALAAFVLIALSGCSSVRHSADEKYYLVATNTKLPYWQAALAGLSRAGAQLGVPVEMVGPDTYDAAEEHKAFQQLLQGKPAGILVSVADSGVIGPDIDAAVAKGIPVITMDSDATSSKRLFFIGTDNYKAGMIGGELMAKLLNGKGNVVVFTMPQQMNLSQRLHGYQDAFSAYPQIKVATVVDIRGDATVAFDQTKAALDSKTKVDGFICLEAIACPEVADVVNRRNMGGKVAIVAMDADQRTLEWIQKGVIAGTVGQKPYTMAYHGVMLLDQLHHYPPQPLAADWTQDTMAPVPAFVDTGATLIDKHNVDTFLHQRSPTSATM